MSIAKLTMIIPTLVQGGAEKQMCLLAAGLPKTEFAVSVLALTAGGPWQEYLQDHGIPVTVIGKRFKLDPFSFRRLWLRLREERPDIVHTWIFAANAYGRLAARLAGVPRIVTGERCVDQWKNEFHFWLDRRLDRFTDAFATNSQGVVDFYQQQRIGLGKFEVIPNGFDTNQGAPDPGAAAHWRERLQLSPTAKLVVAVARLWPQKRLKDLIWAMDLIGCKYDHVHMAIAGEGPELQRLQQFAHEARVPDRVHFVGHLREPASLLQAANLFCLVSQYEGQSNALMEALHWRVPVVISDIPGNRDLIPDETYGLICPVGDRMAIARQIGRVLDDPVAAQERARQAAERLEAHFSVTAMLHGYRQLYRRLLGSTQTAAGGSAVIGETACPAHNER
jgi:glycosyltransferase involved in cell wall biosynthesis